MEIQIVLLAILSSYLIGAISFSRIVTRMVAPETDFEDAVLRTEQGEELTKLRGAGATTASIKLGGRWGCFIGWLDMLKVAMPTLIFRVLYPEIPYFLVAGVFGMVGHNWPIYYRFKGGAGVSAIYGGLMVIDILGAIVCSFAGLIFGMFIVKDILVAYMSGIWFLIPWFWLRTRDPAYVAYAVVVNILIILALLPEIRAQIRAHREGNVDMQTAMQSFPMGRGMIKIMERFGINKQ